MATPTAAFTRSIAFAPAGVAAKLAALDDAVIDATLDAVRGAAKDIS